MVGCRTYGRMGNFLFQAAACIGYSIKHGVEFSLPNITNDKFWNPLYLQHLVNSKWEQGREDILINEIGFPYHEIEFKEDWKDKQVVLNGYWQTEKYFKEYRSEILYLFGYPYEKKEKTVGVHVRRGDYLHLTQKHPPVTKEWYENAMKMFVGFKFNFFSDDIKWCIDNFSSRGDCEFSSNATEEQDMIEGACCEHNIISASTFGWWQAWLNRNDGKKIVLPRLWFTPGWDGIDTSDIVPENWIRL